MTPLGCRFNGQRRYIWKQVIGMTIAKPGTLGETTARSLFMSKSRVFGTFRPRLNVAPLLLTPGFAAIGYAIGGSSGAWWAVAAWLAVVLGAAVSCTWHAWRAAQEPAPRTGRRAFDYDVHNAGR
jgi:hypothetical protein